MSESSHWWRDAVVYQVYLRSFADGNGDGTGDIAGLMSRLPYLASLGVDAIWINPWYVSPLHDGGYDVADYRSIHPRFGTLEDAEELIARARDHGLRVLLDLVPNHTSSEHPWFQEAINSEPGSPARDLYHFRGGKGRDGSSPPNNWRSVFGGPAWTRAADGEWYLHLFDSTQPDLNWSNSQVREEFVSILRYWLDLGASGFRVDVAHALVKDPTYPDVEEASEHVLETPPGDTSPIWDRDELHEIVTEWRSTLDEYPGTVMVAEAWVPTWDRLARYLRPGEYHQAFDFHFLKSPWDAEEIQTRVQVALATSAGVGSVPTWVLSNHDVIRHATRYALPQDIDAREWLLNGDRNQVDTERGLRRARAAVLLMLALPGSVYLYQGEELGLPEVYDLPLEVLDDPVWVRSGHRDKGRDGCRVPIPWTVGGDSFGFGTGGSWLPQPAFWGSYSVEALDGRSGSTYELYRQALQLRREVARGDESIEWLDYPGAVAFRRPGMVCVVNIGSEHLSVSSDDLILGSEPLEAGGLRPDAAAWLRVAPS